VHGKSPPNAGCVAGIPFAIGRSVGARVDTSRSATNALIGSALALLVFCGLPPACSAQAELRKPLVSGLAAVGLCQPEWRLFGPNVHKTNSYLSAEVTLQDGSKRSWTSPDFERRSSTSKFVQGQLPKLYDNLRLDRHRAAWRPLSAWVAQQVAPGVQPRCVRLARHFSDIQPPTAGSWPPVRARRDEYRSHVFYERCW
jgi:hypothetical protein